MGGGSTWRREGEGEKKRGQIDTEVKKHRGGQEKENKTKWKNLTGLSSF